ncbi:hypothetical protein [Tardiphaga sp. vice278]|uniref:hypothetical protein n=1 Tax=Tardiphaga sp. vice278 TaxID=2592815 RepID=UPI0011643107|nr:hypothetical protein [Tardiphaga sp. vice278]QDM19186.1 hypothetical protein FNL53_27080 [Tardiphaga sp. vice278]
MKSKPFAVAAALILFSSGAVMAQGASERTPGDKMQDRGSVKGSPGASGYAPGQVMQEKGSKKGTQGASGYAPGQTTGSSTSSTTKSK